MINLRINLGNGHSRIWKGSVINPERLILSRTRKVSFIRKKHVSVNFKNFMKKYLTVENLTFQV